MPIGVIVSFVIVFALMLLAVSVGMKFFEARRKKQVAEMLHTAAGEPVVTLSNLLKELEPDKPGGLKGLINSLQFSKHAQELIQQAGLNWSSSRLIAAMAMAAVPGLGLGSVLPLGGNSALAALALGAVFASLPYFFVRHKRSSRMDKMEEQLPESLDFLARSMRAGHAFTISMEMLGQELAEPLGQEFRTLFNEINLGAPMDIALRNFTQRVPLLDVRFFSSSVMLQRQTGGNLSEILSRLAYIIRERFRLKGQVKACSAHGRMTASILTALPVLTMIGLLVVAPGYLQGMAEDPDGKWMIGGSIGAQILGNFFIKRIINIKV
jgi:tight adherence protein B